MGVMRVLCLSQEKDLLDQLRTVFGDLILHIEGQTSSQEFLSSAEHDEWDVFLVDFDALSETPSPVQLVRQLPINCGVVIIGSSTFANWHHELKALGALVLHKPAAVGELGVAIRRAIVGRQQRLTG